MTKLCTAVAREPDIEAIAGGFVRPERPVQYVEAAPVRPGFEPVELLSRIEPTPAMAQTYFGCLQAGPGEFVHFRPPLGVLPGEQIHEAHARQPWVAVAVLPEPLVPVGPVAPPTDFEAGLTLDMLRKLAPLVWMHVAQYGFAPIPWSASAWRGAVPSCP